MTRIKRRRGEVNPFSVYQVGIMSLDLCISKYNKFPCNGPRFYKLYILKFYREILNNPGHTGLYKGYNKKHTQL